MGKKAEDITPKFGRQKSTRLDYILESLVTKNPDI